MKSFILIFLILNCVWNSFADPIDKAFLTTKLNLPLIIDASFLERTIENKREIDREKFHRLISYDAGNTRIFTFSDNPTHIFSNGYLVFKSDTLILFSIIMNGSEQVKLVNFNSKGVKSIHSIFDWFNPTLRLNEVKISFMDTNLRIFSCSNSYIDDSVNSKFELFTYDFWGRQIVSYDTLFQYLELGFMLNNFPKVFYEKQNLKRTIKKYGYPFFKIDSVALSFPKYCCFYLGNKKRRGMYFINTLLVKEGQKPKSVIKKFPTP